MYSVDYVGEFTPALDSFLTHLELQADEDRFESSEIMKSSMRDHSSSTRKFIKDGEFWKPGCGLWIIHRGDEPVGLSGVYKRTDDIAVIGARSWISPAHRTKALLGDLVFPKQEYFCTANGYREMWMTFNLNNQWLPNMILRAASGKAIQMGKSSPEFYRGWEEIEPREVRGIFQRILRKAL